MGTFHFIFLSVGRQLDGCRQGKTFPANTNHNLNNIYSIRRTNLYVDSTASVFLTLSFYDIHSNFRCCLYPFRINKGNKNYNFVTLLMVPSGLYSVIFFKSSSEPSDERTYSIVMYNVLSDRYL